MGSLLDVNVYREECGGQSIHFRWKLDWKLYVDGWIPKRMEGVRSVLKASELNKSEKERVYQESLCGEGEWAE